MTEQDARKGIGGSALAWDLALCLFEETRPPGYGLVWRNLPAMPFQRKATFLQLCLASVIIDGHLMVGLDLARETGSSRTRADRRDRPQA
jgi:hypothetical protein